MKLTRIFLFPSLKIATLASIILGMPKIMSPPTVATDLDLTLSEKSFLPAPTILPSANLAAPPTNDLVVPAKPTLNVRADLPTGSIPSESTVDMYDFIICRTTRSQYQYPANTRRIDEGIQYLDKLAHSRNPGSSITVNGTSAVNSTNVSRISCSWNSGIFLINVTPEPISITVAQAVNVASIIRDKCPDMYSQTSGEVMDIISGLVVVISKAICSEDDTLNDNIW